MPKGCRDAKGAFEGRTLADVAAAGAGGVGLTGNTQSTPTKLPVAPAYAFELDVSAGGAAAGDTLSVVVQTKIDGTNWLDVVAFTVVLGNAAVKRHIGKITPAALAEAMFENASALAAGSVRNIAGDEWAVKWTVVDGGAHGQTFTFKVFAVPM